MLAVMEGSQTFANQGNNSKELQTPDESFVSASQQFLDSGRTGRRNALPDILDANRTELSSSDLPAKMDKLSTVDNKDGSASGSHES